MASLNAMSACIAEQEKSRKPKLTRAETIKQLCKMSEFRTELFIDAIRTKKTDDIKNSQDMETAKKYFYYIMESQAADRLSKENQIDNEELEFCQRYFKADQEPEYNNKLQEDLIKVQTFKFQQMQQDTTADTSTQSQ